jgi:hypothetical protein
MSLAVGHDRKQERVLEAAASVFAERGFHNASVLDVVAAAGISQAKRAIAGRRVRSPRSSSGSSRGGGA